MIVPRPFLTGPLASRGAGSFSLSELLVRKLYRWTRPCFSLPHDLTERRFRFSGHVFNAQLSKPEPFLARF
jgi:hypothetical protein